MCISFLLENPDQAKGKPELNKKRYLPVLRTTHANNTQNSDIVADTNHTQKENLQKYSKTNFSIQNYFSPDISKRNLVKSINKMENVTEVGTPQENEEKTSCFCLLLKICIKKKSQNSSTFRYACKNREIRRRKQLRI